MPFRSSRHEDHPGRSRAAFPAVEIADATRSGEAIHPDPGFPPNRMHRVSLRRYIGDAFVKRPVPDERPSSKENESMVEKINKRIVTLMEFFSIVSIIFTAILILFYGRKFLFG